MARLAMPCPICGEALGLTAQARWTDDPAEMLAHATLDSVEVLLRTTPEADDHLRTHTKPATDT